MNNTNSIVGKISQNNLPMNNSINGSSAVVNPASVIAPSSQQHQHQQPTQIPSKGTKAPSNGIAQPPQPTAPPSSGTASNGKTSSASNSSQQQQQQQQSNANNLNSISSSMPCSSISGSVASNDDHHHHNQQLPQHQPHHHHHHQHHHHHGGHNEHLSKTNLYIRGLKADTSDEDLYNLCSRYGNISSTKAILDRSTNSCKGYGFVDFESPQAAEVAVQELLKQGVLAQMAKVRPVLTHHHHHHHNQNPVNSQNDQDPTNLYLANLPSYMNEQELESLLSHYGPVVSTRILRDPSNNPRGVGFARMETRDKCEQIIKQLNGKPCKGGNEPLLVKFADGGNRKRMHHHKVHNDSRWRDSGDMMGLPNFDHQTGVSHNNLPNQMMTQIGYPRTAHGYSASVTAASYPAASSTQWLHPAQAGQPYVIPPSVMPPSSLDPSGQAAAALHYVAPMPQLTAQMQGLQLAPHSGQQVGGYLQHQQWPPQLWAQLQHQQQQPVHQQQTQQQQFAAAQQQTQQGGKSQQQQGTANTPSIPSGDWLAVDRS